MSLSRDQVNKLDFLVWMASFLGTLFISIEIGLGIAIGLAMLIVIYESAFPHTAMLGRIPGSGVYRNVKQYPSAQLVPGVMVCRIDAPIYFANVQWIKDRLRAYEARHRDWSGERGTLTCSTGWSFGTSSHPQALYAVRATSTALLR